MRGVRKTHLKADDINKLSLVRLKEINKLMTLMQIYLLPTIAYIRKCLALHV